MRVAKRCSYEINNTILFHFNISRFITTSSAIWSLIVLKDKLLAILGTLDGARIGRPSLIAGINLLTLNRSRGCLEDLLRLRTFAVECSLTVLQGGSLPNLGKLP